MVWVIVEAKVGHPFVCKKEHNGILKLTTDIVAANKSSKYQGCLICGRDRSGKDIEFVGEGSDRVLILSDYIQGREDHTPKKIFSAPQYNVLWHVQGKKRHTQ